MRSVKEKSCCKPVGSDPGVSITRGIGNHKNVTHRDKYVLYDSRPLTSSFREIINLNKH